MQPIRFAVVGIGNIGKVHLQAIAATPGSQTVVICNRTEATGAPIAETIGARWYADYREAVRQPDVDAVAICTPTGTHMEIAVAAAEAGKHLLMEKPLDVTLGRTDRILQAADAANVKVACIFPRRFAVGAQTARQAIAAGRLGRVTLVEISVKWHRPQSYYDGSWRGTWALDGGGAVMNQSIHYIDLAQWLVGPVTQVGATTATLAHEMQAEDTACAWLRFAGGAAGCLLGSTAAWPGEPAVVAVHGDRGSIVLEEGRIVRWKIQDGDADEEAAMLRLEEVGGSGAADPTAIGYEMHRRQVEDFVEAIRSDRAPAIPGAEGRHAVEIVRALYHSARTGAAVSLPFHDDA